MGEGKTDRVACGDLLRHIQDQIDAGWLIRSANIDWVSMGSPGNWTEPEDWFYFVRVMRLVKGDDA